MPRTDKAPHYSYSPDHLSSSSSSSPKKKHVCPTCSRAFTTSGHLARHARVHTGERNHKCPFPGCETRCSRQDNLQQHYRIHLSPGSRRSSTRSAISRAMNTSTPTGSSKRSSVSSDSSPPPALEPARLYVTPQSPPDTPPRLEPATLPVATATATATTTTTATMMQHLADPASSRSVSPPEEPSPYSPHHMMSMQSNAMSLPAANQSYSYRSGTTTYQEQSQGAAGFTYVHTTPIHSSSNAATNNFSYSNPHGSFGNHTLPHMASSSSSLIHNTRHPSESSISSAIASRHSISHISHPNSYSHPHPCSSSGGPPSPASSHSVSSHTSGPPTPTYPVFHEDGGHSYHHGTGLLTPEQHAHHPHMVQQNHLLHPNNVYHQHQQHQHQQHQQHQQQQQQQQHHHPSHHQSSNSNATTSMSQLNGASRFSPPPTLAPIQDERYIRRDDRHHSNSHTSSPYIHHPQPLASEYPYHQPLSMTTAAWKSDHGMRKGVGALVQ